MTMTMTTTSTSTTPTINVCNEKGDDKKTTEQAN